jgi:rhomboid protease GluP
MNYYSRLFKYFILISMIWGLLVVSFSLSLGLNSEQRNVVIIYGVLGGVILGFISAVFVALLPQEGYEDEEDEEDEEKTAFFKLLSDSTPRLFITPTILSINVLIFAVMVLSGVSLFDPEIEHLLDWGASFGPMTVNHWWRHFTSTFLHVGLMHLWVNMWVLFIIGSLAERMFGNWTFLMLYLFSGLGGSIASLWWNPTVVSAGASSAIFGVAGGLIIFLSLGKMSVPRQIIKRLYISVLFFVGFNLFYGFMESGIDNAAHLGGFLTGLLMSAFLHRPLPPPMPYPRLRYYIVFSGVALSLILCAGFAKRHALNDPFVKYVVAVTLLEEGELDRGIEEVEKAIELNSDFARGGHYALGDTYMKKGRYDEAVASFTNAIDIDPGFAGAYSHRANAYFYQARFTEAEKDYEKYLSIKPEHKYYKLMLYLSRERAGKDGRTILAEQVKPMDLDDWPGPVFSLYLGRAAPEEVLEATGDNDKKVQGERQCEAFFYLGQYYLLRGEKEKAVEMFRRAIDTGVTDFIEYGGARAELERLGL